MQQLLVRHVEVLRDLEQRFTRHLGAGRLRDWSAEDVRDAIRLSHEHKVLAMQAIERERLDQALNNIETIIYIMSGFLESIENDVDPSTLN